MIYSDCTLMTEVSFCPQGLDFGQGATLGHFYLEGTMSKNNIEYKVNKNGCWEWQKCKNDKGYGQMYFGGKMIYAHRYYYEQKNGKIMKEDEAIERRCGAW